MAYTLVLVASRSRSPSRVSGLVTVAALMLVALARATAAVRVAMFLGCTLPDVVTPAESVTEHCVFAAMSAVSAVRVMVQLAPGQGEETAVANVVVPQPSDTVTVGVLAN